VGLRIRKLDLFLPGALKAPLTLPCEAQLLLAQSAQIARGTGKEKAIGVLSLFSQKNSWQGHSNPSVSRKHS
jgi:hypothetical protein